MHPDACRYFDVSDNGGRKSREAHRSLVKTYFGTCRYCSRDVVPAEHARAPMLLRAWFFEFLPGPNHQALTLCDRRLSQGASSVANLILDRLVGI
jgi:hypothetical protein